MKRNVIISGEFTVNEVSNTQCSHSSRPKAAGKTAADRIAALKAAGVDVSNYFPMGDDMIVRVDDGVPSQVMDDDPVFAKICSGGHIAHSKLYRRWVMAQMFRMLRLMERYNKDFTAVLQLHGYDYSWKMLEHELLAQYKMCKHGDTASFSERNRWFNRDVAVEMGEQYLEHLSSLISGLKTRHCRRRPYKRICGENVFADEIAAKVLAPVRSAIQEIFDASSPYQLHQAVVRLNRIRRRLPWQTKVSKAFVDAYKGAGAYFTMKNLILFHGAHFSSLPSEQQSLSFMERQSAELEGWELLGLMKRLIADSGISVERKMAEWRKR